MKAHSEKFEKEWKDKFDINTGKLKSNLSNACYEWAKKNQDRLDELEEEMKNV